MLQRLKVESAEAIHEFIIEKYGGTKGIINIGGLESALARPFSGYYNTPAAQAAALMHGLIKNHAFLDGNKRTAVMATLLTLDFSGYEISATRQFSRIDDVAEKLANNKFTQQELEIYFRRRMRPKKKWATYGVHQFADHFY